MDSTKELGWNLTCGSSRTPSNPGSSSQEPRGSTFFQARNSQALSERDPEPPGRIARHREPRAVSGQSLPRSLPQTSRAAPAHPARRLAPLAPAPWPLAGGSPRSAKMLPRSAALAGAPARQRPPRVVPSVLRGSRPPAAPPGTLGRRTRCCGFAAARDPNRGDRSPASAAGAGTGVLVPNPYPKLLIQRLPSAGKRQLFPWGKFETLDKRETSVSLFLSKQHGYQRIRTTFRFTCTWKRLKMECSRVLLKEGHDQ